MRQNSFKFAYAFYFSFCPNMDGSSGNCAAQF